MLYIMRNRIKTFVMWLIIGAFVLTIFYAWGVGSARRGKNRGGQDWIAKVEGQIITPRELENELQRLRTRFQDLPPQLLKQLDLKKQALDNLIDRQLMVMEAEKMGIGIPDQELAIAIEESPSFQENGSFNRQVYRQVLAWNQLTPALYEKQERTSLQIQKVQDLIRDTAKVSKSEVHEAWLRKNETVRVQYALLKPLDHLPKRKPSDREIRETYEKNREAYRTQEALNAVFSYITPREFFDQIQVPEEKVKEYYEDNRSVYVQPEKIHARHILIRVPRNADEKTRKAALEKINQIREKAQAGESFAALARKYSEDSSNASRGGDLGFFERGQMVKNFDRTAFSLKPGEISPVVKTQFGYHIIRVEARQEAKEKTLDSVRDEILTKLKFGQGLRLAKRKAMQLYAKIRKGADFQKTLREAGFPVHESGYFSRTTRSIPDVPLPLTSRFVNEAFAAGADGMGGAIRGEKGILLLKVVNRREPKIPALDEVREKVIETLRKKMARNNAKRAAEQMVDSLKKKVSLPEAAKAAGAATTGTTKAFTRNETLFTPDFTRTAFTLTKENPAAYVSAGDTFYVMLLKERETPKKEDPESEAVKTLQKGLLAKQQNSLLTAWLHRIREESKIEVNQEFLDRI